METGIQKEIEIIAYHGWGFDGGFWSIWKKELEGNIDFKTVDRGYFLNPGTARFSKDKKLKILMAHSFGVHFSSGQNIREADIVVIFNGFENFHPVKGKEKSDRILKKMIARFREKPLEVLHKFWDNVFYPKIYSHNKKKGIDIDKELLLEDLIELGKSRSDLEDLARGNPVISIDGGQDKILGHPRGEVFTQLSERNAVYHLIRDAGHALPLTHFRDCWSFITAMIPIFTKYEQDERTKEIQRY